jgi:uncharacterized repeat protein (TIGR01451 family)
MFARSLFSRPRRAIAIVTVIATAVVGLGLTSSASAEDPSTPPAATTERFIVTFPAGTSTAERDAILSEAGAVQVSSVPQLRLYAAEVSAEGADALRADPRVERVEADRVRAVEATPDDPGYADQWALPQIGWDQAYGTVNPAGSATVAVLDTGVNATEDLAANLVPGASMLADSDTTADPNGHGTAMAGIIAAKTNNGTGTAGVAYAGVSVMPVKVLGADGTGQDSDIVAGVVYAADHGADVILMSFSNPGRSDALQAAVDYAWSKGAVVVAATGNDGGSAATYPAGTAKVIGVSATTQDDTLWSGSNFGTDTFLGAPGVDIATGSGSLTGTSTSAAIVAGTAALVKANDASASNGVVVGRLARTADAAGTADQTGNGRVNLARALSDSSTEAVVPQGVAGNGGPFVGPYVAAAQLNGALQGQANPACVSPSPCPWQTTSLDGWAELQTIPLRLFFASGQQGSTAKSFTISIDHAAGATAGLQSLTNFTRSANVTIAGGLPGGVSFVDNGNSWDYTFTASITDNTAGFVAFDTRMLAGAHAFTGASLQVKASGGSGTLSIFKPLAAPGSPDLVVTKSAPAAVSPGQTMTYTVSYRNAAAGTGTVNRATGVQLTDTLPAGTTYVANSCTGCTFDLLTNTLSWTIGTVLANSSLVSLTYQVTVGAGLTNGTTLVNGAQILSAENDANVADNTASVTTTVFTLPLISGAVINDQNGDGVMDPGELGLAGATITLYRDDNANGIFDGAPTDPQVGSPVTTPASGEWGFTGLAKNTTYFVVRANPATYTSTAAIAEAVATDHSTATAPTNDRLKVVFDSVAGSTSSTNNYFLAKLAKQNQTITFAQPAPATYGASFNVNPTASSGLVVSLAATGGCSAAPASPGPGWTVTMTSGTVDCVLTASQAGNSNWNPAPDVARTVSATARAVTVTADGKSQVYGAALQSLTYQVTAGSLAPGDSFTGALSRASGSNVGSYAIGQNTLALNSNYALTYVGANYVITARPITVTAVTDTKVYDATTSSDETPTITSGTLVTGDTANFTQSFVTASVGTGKTLVPAGSVSDGNSGNNYAVTFANDTTGAITARAVTVKANNQTKTYGDVFTFAGTEFTVSVGTLASSDAIASVTLSSTGAAGGATVAGSPYPILVGNAVFSSGSASNYNITYVNGAMTVTPRDANVAYIGQTTFVSSGSSSTTAQVTLTASVADPDGSGTVAAGTVTFTDLLTNKVLASGVKVSPVSNSTSNTGTATTTVTLSTGQYGAQSYLIEVTLDGSYKNTQQTGAAPGSPAYEAAHPVVTVMIPPTAYSTQGTGSLTKLASAAGTYADATQVRYTLGMKYNSKGTSPQGQVQLILQRGDGTYYVKSNSISSLAFSGATGGQPAKDVTIYTKASIYKIVNGVLTSIDGGVTLRLDAHEGCTSSPTCGGSSGDTIGVTVLSSKTSFLYYSNNWLYDSSTKSWRTMLQAVTGPNGTAVVIN